MKEIPSKDVKADPSTYITSPGTLTVNTNTNVVSIHNGVTPGGTPLTNIISVIPSNVSSLSPIPPAGTSFRDPTTGLIYGQGDGQGGYVTDSPVSLPFYRRMEAARRGLTRFTAQGLLTRASGDGTTVKQLDQPMVYDGKDWVTQTRRLELFRFSGGMPVAAGCGIPYNAKIVSVQSTTVTLDRPAVQNIAGNGLKMLFGSNTVPLSYTCAGALSSAVITGISDTSKLFPNMRVFGGYVPANALILTVQPGVGFTMTGTATGAVSTVYITGIELTAGSTVGSPVLNSPGSATLSGNTANLSVGMTVVGAPVIGANQTANDHLIIQIPAGVITPNARLRLEYSFSEIFTSGGNAGYANGVLNSVIAVRQAGASNQQGVGLSAASHSINVTIAATAKLFTKHYMEIQFLNNVAQFNYDGETGSAGARLFGQSISDFASALEMVFRPYYTGNDPFHTQAQLDEVSLTVYY